MNNSARVLPFPTPSQNAPQALPDKALWQMLDFSFMRQHLFLPLAFQNKEASPACVTVAVAQHLPLFKQMALADDYRRLSGFDVQLQPQDAALLEAQIQALWTAHSHAQEPQQSTAHFAEKAVAENTVRSLQNLHGLASRLTQMPDLLEHEDDAPIIQLINALILQAQHQHASDIHIEPYARSVRVRLRIDGVLQTILKQDIHLHAAMAARLKVMAHLDMAEKRLPQDGRFSVMVGGNALDIRLSTLPTQHGERLVLRLLERDLKRRSLADLGLRAEQIKLLQQAFQLPHGIVFFSGPTGAGKTSSLYAGLQEMDHAEKNIVTVEEPVEYALEGIGQIPVNSKIGLTFAAGLRSVLRQDPDVVVIGETRDAETARIAMEASLTGHLVLSTIHTNSAAATLTRLVNMGIEPFLVASSMRMVVAQRMVRLLHPQHKKPVPLNEATYAFFAALPEAVRPARHEITLFEATPHPDCPTGYKGRTGLFEIMRLTDPLQAAILAGASEAEIASAARAEGMLTLFEEGLLKAARGETSLDEIFRVTRLLQLEELPEEDEHPTAPAATRSV